MLKAMPVLVLHGRHDDLFPLEMTALELEQRVGRRVPPLGQKHDERQGLRRVGQQSLEMIDHGLHELLAVGRIRLEAAAYGPEVEKGPARAEVGVGVGERRAVLSEVAVERRGEALEAAAEGLLKALEHGDGQGHLGGLALGAAQVGLVALEHAPDAGEEHLELAIVEAVVAVELLELGQVGVVDAHRVPVEAQHRLLALR